MEGLNEARNYCYGVGSGALYIIDEFGEPTEVGTVNTPIPAFDAELVNEKPDAEYAYIDHLMKDLSKINEFECTLDCDLSEFFDTVNHAMNSAFNRLWQALIEVGLLSYDSLEDLREFAEKLERRNEEYSFRVKKYDKYSRSQTKQFKTPVYRNKNVPYRRCDRSK